MINTLRCPNGHFYDASRFQVCPYCGASTGVAAPQTQSSYSPVPSARPPQSVNHIPQNNTPYAYSNQAAPRPAMPQQQAVPVPSPVQQAAPMNTAANIFSQPANTSYNDQDEEEMKQPTVGWLVCIGGASKGKSYPIRENRNFIGRSPSMDICIQGDKAVSREKHGIITYVPKQRLFIAQPGESRELFYVNDKVVLDNMELDPYDKLEIGKSMFLFVPLCGTKFSWDDYSRDQ